MRHKDDALGVLLFQHMIFRAYQAKILKLVAGKRKAPVHVHADSRQQGDDAATGRMCLLLISQCHPALRWVIEWGFLTCYLCLNVSTDCSD